MPADLERGALMLRDGLLPAISSGVEGVFGEMIEGLLADVFGYFGEGGSVEVAESFVGSEVEVGQNVVEEI